MDRSLQLILLGFSYIPLIYGFIITFQNYKKKQHIHLLFACFTLISAIIWFSFDFFGYILDDPSLFKYSIYPYTLLGLLIFLQFDIMVQERFSSIKMFIFGGLLTAIILTSLEDTAILIDSSSPYYTINFGGNFGIVMNILNFFLAISFTYYFIQIAKSVPHILRKKTRKLFAFLCLILISSLLGGNYFLQNIFPGIHLFLFCLGFGGLTFEFNKHVWLGYIVPTKPIRLMVIHLKSGLPLFTFNWPTTQDIIDEVLFSGMLHGIRSILDESIQHGNIQEIKLEKGILILENRFQNSISVALVATNSSKSLRYALSLFTERFLNYFQSDIQFVENYSHFTSASKIVKECFDFLPDTVAIISDK